MQKIKVITRHAIINYGSLLQSLATIKIFEDNGFDVQIIDYISKKETVINNLISFANMRNFNGIKKVLYIIFKLPHELLKSIKFIKMRKKYLKMTKKYSELEDMKGEFDNQILCSGGDQLWGYMPYNEIDNAYYLNFGNSSNKFISLSSSFGRYDFTAEEKEKIAFNLKKYNFISVREKSAEEFLSGFNIDSKNILDPTLLIERKYWYSLTENNKIREKYVLVYKLRRNNILNEMAEHIAKKENLKIVYINNVSFDFKNRGKVYSHVSIEKLLTLFKNAEYVVTDSFHATVFSVIFERQFFVHLPGKTNARIIDFLNMLNISGRCFDKKEDFSLKDDINYTNVNDILKREKQKSLSYLSNKLNEIKL